jgi:hypothetical protein
MSTALRLLEQATFKEYKVAVTKTTFEGRAVILTDAENVEDAAGATDLAVGVARDTITSSATVIQRCGVTLFGPVEAVTVGTGGATLGKKAILAADGFTDAPAHDSSGGTNDAIYGIFMQSGTAGQKVGLMLMAGNRGSA